jgi:hypothetical protein
LKQAAGDDTVFYSFMDSPSDAIFMLRTLLEFECSDKCPFCTCNESVNAFIEKSLARVIFRLDFVYELAKVHKCSWAKYVEWTKSAIETYPSVPAINRHLVNVYTKRGARFRDMADWKMMDPEKKRQRALAMFASEYLLYQNACNSDDNFSVKISYKRICSILEETASLLSDSYMPDSLIWRVLYYMERERNSPQMDKVI